MLTHIPGLFAFLGLVELFVFALVVLLLFGNRLPGLMRGVGQGITEFKKGVQGIEDQSDADKNKDAATKSGAK